MPFHHPHSFPFCFGFLMSISSSKYTSSFFASTFFDHSWLLPCPIVEILLSLYWIPFFYTCRSSCAFAFLVLLALFFISLQSILPPSAHSTSLFPSFYTFLLNSTESFSPFCSKQLLTYSSFHTFLTRSSFKSVPESIPFLFGYLPPTTQPW